MLPRNTGINCEHTEVALTTRCILLSFFSMARTEKAMAPYSSTLAWKVDGGAWWAAVHGVTKSQTRLSDFPFTLHFHALEKEMATHSSVLAWRISGAWEPGGLPSMGSHRVRHDWSDLAAAAASARKEQYVLCVRSNSFSYFTDELESKVNLYPLPRWDHLITAWKALRAWCWRLWCTCTSPLRQACCINLGFL